MGYKILRDNLATFSAVKVIYKSCIQFEIMIQKSLYQNLLGN